MKKKKKAFEGKKEKNRQIWKAASNTEGFNRISGVVRKD